MQTYKALGLVAGLLSLAKGQLVVQNVTQLQSSNADADDPQCDGTTVQRDLFQAAHWSATWGVIEAMNAYDSYAWCYDENAFWCPDVINSTVSSIAGRAIYNITQDIDLQHCDAICLSQSLMTVANKAGYSAMLWAEQNVNGTETWDNSTWIERKDKIENLYDGMWRLEQEIKEPKQIDGDEVSKLMNCTCFESIIPPALSGNHTTNGRWNTTGAFHNSTNLDRGANDTRKACTCNPIVDESETQIPANASLGATSVSSTITVSVYSYTVPTAQSTHHITVTHNETDLELGTPTATIFVATQTVEAPTTAYQHYTETTTISSNPSPAPKHKCDHDDCDDDHRDVAMAALPLLAAGAAIPIGLQGVKGAIELADPVLSGSKLFLKGVTSVTKRASGPFSWFGHLFRRAGSVASSVAGSVTDSVIDTSSSLMSDIRSQSSFEDLLPPRPPVGVWQPMEPLPPIPPTTQGAGTQTEPPGTDRGTQTDRNQADKETQTVWDEEEKARIEVKKARQEAEDAKKQRDEARKKWKKAEARLKKAAEESQKAKKEAEDAERERAREKEEKAKKEQERAEKESEDSRREQEKAEKLYAEEAERQRSAERRAGKARIRQQEAAERAQEERVNPNDVWRSQVYDPNTRTLGQRTVIRAHRQIQDGMKAAQMVRKGLKSYYVLGPDGRPLPATGGDETEAPSDRGYWVVWKGAGDLLRTDGDWRRIGKGDQVQYVQYLNGKPALNSQGEPLVRNDLGIMDTVQASNTEKLKKYEEGIKYRVFDAAQEEVLKSPDGRPELSLSRDGESVQWNGQEPEAGPALEEPESQTSLRPHPSPDGTMGPEEHTVTETSVRTTISTKTSVSTEVSIRTITSTASPSRTTETETRLCTTTEHTPSTKWRPESRVETKTRYVTKYVTSTTTTSEVRTVQRPVEVTAYSTVAPGPSFRYLMTEQSLPPGVSPPVWNEICLLPHGCSNLAAPTGCHIECPSLMRREPACYVPDGCSNVAQFTGGCAVVCA